MLQEEPLQGEALHTNDMEDTRDGSDETLSLCDLPLYSEKRVEEWEEDPSAESQGSSSMSSSEQDCFEFFSQELNRHSTTKVPPEDILFCGKLIKYKQPEPSEKDESEVGQIQKQSSTKKERGWGIFRWKFGWSNSSSKSTSLVHQKGHQVSNSLHQAPNKKMFNSNKHGKGYGFQVQKMSILTSSSSGKARRYMSRFSTQVELKDIKSRPSRRQAPPTLPTSPALRSQNYDQNVSRGNNMSSGPWGLIKVLSCGDNHHPNAMVVASISSSPRK